MKFADKLLTNKWAILAIYIVFALAASMQSLLLGNEVYQIEGKEYISTHYNNYVIFKNSFLHLIKYKDLYQFYFDENWDLFKYSPTFALFFGFFYALPDAIGLSLWNILNAVVIFAAVYYLPNVSIKNKGIILLSVLIELMTCMQNEQSNALICGLIILAFGLLERGNYFVAVFCIVFTVYIKLFGIVALALFIFYPGKLKLALYTLFWSLLLLALPLIVVDLAQLKFLYESWGRQLVGDHSVSLGLSVAGWLDSWFKLSINKSLVTLLGAALFCVPFVRVREYKNYSFRLLALASVLIWVVIFNHRAESPTFIVAMGGAAIWAFTQPVKLENMILFIIAFVFTSLSPTDIFPLSVRINFFQAYCIKAVPCIVIWVKIIYDQLFTKGIQLRVDEQRFDLAHSGNNI